MKVPEELLPVVEWWERNGKRAMLVGGVVAVVAIVGFSWSARRARNRAAAAQATFTAAESLLDVRVGADGDGSKEAAVAKIRETAGGSSSTPLQKLMLADALVSSGKAEELASARGILEELAAEGDSLPVICRDLPAFKLCVVLESEKKFDEARKAYEDFAGKNQKSVNALEAKLGVARCLAQSGKKDEAVDYLESLDGLSDGEKNLVESTVSLVKRWVPANQRIIGEKPVSETPAAPDVAPAAPAAPEVAPAAPAAPDVAPAAPVAPDVAPESVKAE
ncbi:MAG: tetratricopeptide repeat protein [Kiritimatiellae bacterium]|nr:tetratricopeptide repeat protein [Kiritimatiellia bacterium]